MCHMHMIDCMKVWTSEFSRGIVLFGSIFNFLFLADNNLRKEISSFKNYIYYKYSCYFVDLLWEENELKTVPSNHQVSFNV